MMNPVSDQRNVLLRDGTPILIRRLMTEDAALYPDFLSEVTAADLRLRFFASMRAVSENLVDKLIHYDPAHAMAFIAIEEQSRKLLGVAILVRSRLKSHGVGWLLMQRMIEFAKWKGLRTVHGQVLTENTTMLTMCGEFGFHIAHDPEEPGVASVTLQTCIENPALR
jgi:GNAT superfamily N-acetyltransferase